MKKIFLLLILSIFINSNLCFVDFATAQDNKVYFVDFNQICIETIEKNLRSLKITEEAVVLKKDYLEALRYFKERDIKFQIIFLDPPYKYHFMTTILQELEQFGLLEKDVKIICESDNQEQIDTKLKLIKEKKYGSKWIHIYKKEN